MLAPYIVILAFVHLSVPVYKVELQPFDLTETESGAVYLGGVDQLESDGELLYIRDVQSPHILAVDASGRLRQTIGGLGGGPGEFRSNPVAIALRGEALWVLSDGGRRASYFERGEFMLGFAVNSYNITIGSSANAFDFTNEAVAIPAHPSTGRLAAVYGYGGELQRLAGKIAPIDPEILRKNPAFNDTMWRRDGDHWYCLFQFRPTLLKFNRDFEQTAAFRLRGPEMEHREEAFEKFEPQGMSSIPPGHFTDIKFYRGDLFVMAPKALYQIDPQSGETLSRTYFIYRGEEGSRKGRTVARMTMAFLKDGVVVLGHPALVGNHDLWKVRLPFLDNGGD